MYLHARASARVGVGVCLGGDGCVCGRVWRVSGGGGGVGVWAGVYGQVCVWGGGVCVCGGADVYVGGCMWASVCVGGRADNS